MRVAMVIQVFDPVLGGAQRQVERLGPPLKERSVDVQVITRRVPDTPSFERRPGLEVHRVGRALTGAAASVQYSSLGALTVARLHPDVIHAHDLLSPSTAALLASRGGSTPVVVKVLSAGLGGDIDRLLRKPFGRRRLAAMAHRFSAFIALSDEVAAELREHGVPAERIRRIPNGVDADAFRPATPEERARERAALGVGEDELLAIYCGRFYETKHVDVLIDAARHAGFRLLVYGEGPVEQDLRRLAGDRVEVRKPVRDTAPLHRAADLYLSASEAEGMSGSVLEAMAAGTAVIAAPAPGMEELLGDGAGVLTSERTPEAFADAVSELASADARRPLAEAARARVVERYSLESVAEQLAALYRELAPEAAPAREVSASAA